MLSFAMTMEESTKEPRLELEQLMESIGATDKFTSWPYGLERRIEDWVDAGDPKAPPPFDDRRGIVTPEFFERLRSLRQQCGGWLYWNGERVVFAPESEWQKVRAEQEAAAERLKAVFAKFDQKAKQLPQILASARNDALFWNELKSWELAREAKRPAELPKVPGLSGPLKILPKAQSEAPKDIDLLLLPAPDAIFVDFIARACPADNVLTKVEVVFHLRGEVRRELGLDEIIFWAGGPGIGNG